MTSLLHKMGNPKISIIVPVYNSEKYLPQCIDSILEQTYTDLELILVNDGSLDGSGVLCDEYAAKDERIRVFHKENRGVSSARNVGIEAASGVWITFVDSDDIIPQDALTNLISLVRKDSVQLVVAGYEMFNDESTFCSSWSAEYIEKALPIDSALEQMYTNSFWPWLMCSKLFSRDVVISHDIRFDESVKYCEDKLFITEFMCAMNGKTSFSSLPVYKYRSHDQSAEGKVKNIYNEGKLTGFIASVKTYQTIYTSNINAANKRKALNDFVNSYRTNLSMLKKCGLWNSELKDKVDDLFFSNIPRRRYVCFLIFRKLAMFITRSKK